MATTIITKTGAGRPANGELERGELGVSPSTGELFTSTNGTDIVPLVDADTPGLPAGTANRQSLSWNGSSWVASSQVLLDITAGQVIVAGAAPTANNHLTRKDYVDNAIDGVLPTGTATNQSLYWNGSAWLPTSAVKLNASSGQVEVTGAAPTANNHLTRKDYVDAQITATRNYVDQEIDDLNILKDSAYIDGEIAQILYGNGVQSIVRLGEGVYRVTFNVAAASSTAQTVVCTIQSKLAVTVSAFILNAQQIEVTVWSNVASGGATPVDGKFFIHRTRG